MAQRRVASFVLVAGLCLVAATLAAPASAAQPPPLPHAFYGVVEVNGQPAPAGAAVEARGTGVMTGVPGNPIAVGQAGKYGGPTGYDPKLVVQGQVAQGTPLEFYVNGVRAQCAVPGGAWQDTYPFTSGMITELNLRVVGALPTPSTSPAVQPAATSSPTARPTSTVVPTAGAAVPTSSATARPGEAVSATAGATSTPTVLPLGATQTRPVATVPPQQVTAAVTGAPTAAGQPTRAPAATGVMVTPTLAGAGASATGLEASALWLAVIVFLALCAVVAFVVVRMRRSG